MIRQSDCPARAHVWGKQAERSEAVGGSPDLALTDMAGRIYDPLAARFTTADPVMQAPFWSQGLNRYSYVFNDPLNNTDPSGYMSTGEWTGARRFATTAQELPSACSAARAAVGRKRGP